MNVLYLNGDTSSGRYVLLTPKSKFEGAWSDFRAEAHRAGVRGPTTLVMNGELFEMPSLPDMSAGDREPFLDSKMQGFTVTAPHLPTLVSVHDRESVQALINNSRASGLKPTVLIPLAACAVRQAGITGTCVVIRTDPGEFEATIISTSNPVTRRTPRNDRMDLAKLVDIATKQFSVTGQQFSVVLITNEDAGPTLPQNVHVVGLEDVLRAALHHPSTPDTESERSAATNRISFEVANQSRSVIQRKTVDRVLIGTIGVAALLNAGLYIPAKITEQQNIKLQGQVAELTDQAMQYRALQTENSGLERQVTQAKTISSNKGPLAEDLPLIVSRVRMVSGTISDLNGPNQPSETDTRSFGNAVARTYDLNITAPSAEEVARAYQQSGLLADIRSVTCKSLCEVSLRVAPAAVIAPTTASGTEGDGQQTAGVSKQADTAAPGSQQ